MDIDVKQICRICLNEGNMMSVFKVNISKKIMSCAAVQVWPNDGLPSQICNKCTAKLHISFQFKKLTEKSDSKLREYLLKKKEISTSQLQSHTSKKDPKIMTLHQENVVNGNLYVVPKIEPSQNNHNFTSGNQHVNFSTQGNLVCHNSIVQVNEYNNVYQMPTVHLEPMVQIYATQSQQGMISDVQQHIQPDINLATDNVHIIQSVQDVNVPLNEVQNSTNENIADISNQTPESLPKKDDVSLVDEKKTSCEVCGKILASLPKLTRHMNIHSQDAPLKCSVCNKGFIHSGNLKIHMRMHSGERPYKCNICGYECRQQQDIEKHIRTHTGERPYSCHWCPKAFAARSNLIAHIRTHTGERPYVCSVCQKAFCQSNELSRHMRTHTGEKTHTCAVCQKGFNGASSLKSHQRLHTGEKPYYCKVCNKSFSQSHTLKVHIRKHAICAVKESAD